jgi:hypothetical protein
VFTGVAAGIGQDVSLAQAGFMNGMHWFTLGTTYWCKLFHACGVSYS